MTGLVDQSRRWSDQGPDYNICKYLNDFENKNSNIGNFVTN